MTWFCILLPLFYLILASFLLAYINLLWLGKHFNKHKSVLQNELTSVLDNSSDNIFFIDKGTINIHFNFQNTLSSVYKVDTGKINQTEKERQFMTEQEKLLGLRQSRVWILTWLGSVQIPMSW